MFKRFSYLVAAIATLAAARLAAVEATSYPGGNCVTAHGSAAAAAPQWSGEFGTDSTTATLAAYCPVETNSSDPEVTSAAVVLLDRHPNENACCSITAQFIDSGGVVWFNESGPMCSTGFGSQPQIASAAVNFGAIGRNMQFQCSIPRRTSNGRWSIFRYQISR